MSIGDKKLLEPYTTKIKQFPKDIYKIIFINNSNASTENKTRGIFYIAKILKQDLTKSRVINSMMLNMTCENEKDRNNISESEFIITDHIRKYKNKPKL